MWLVSTQRLMLLISVMNFRPNLSQVDHLLLTDFMPVLFLYPLKTSEKLCFYEVFRGCRKIRVAWISFPRSSVQIIDFLLYLNAWIPFARKLGNILGVFFKLRMESKVTKYYEKHLRMSPSHLNQKKLASTATKLMNWKT